MTDNKEDSNLPAAKAKLLEKTLEKHGQEMDPETQSKFLADLLSAQGEASAIKAKKSTEPNR